MIQGLPPNKCKAAQAREDEQKRADERAKQAMQNGKKGGKVSESSDIAAQPAYGDAKQRKRDRTMAMPNISTRPSAAGGGAQKKPRTGHYDRDGFLIPEDIPLSELELVEVEVNGLPRVVPTIAITKEQVRIGNLKNHSVLTVLGRMSVRCSAFTVSSLLWQCVVIMR